MDKVIDKILPLCHDAESFLTSALDQCPTDKEMAEADPIQQWMN